MNQTEFKARVKTIIRKEEKWTMLTVGLTGEKNKTATCLVFFPFDFKDGLIYKWKGVFESSPKNNNKIFKVSEVYIENKLEEEDYVELFSSKLFPSITKTDANKILSHFKDPIKTIIDNENEFRSKIKLSADKTEIVIQKVKEHYKLQEVIEFFSINKLNQNVLAIYAKKYMQDSELITKKFKEDNFIDLVKVNYFPFDDAMNIYLAYNNNKVDNIALSWYGWFSIKKYLEESGHSYVNLEKALDLANTATGKNTQEILSAFIEYAKKNKVLIFNDKKIYTPESFRHEQTIAESINQINNQSIQKQNEKDVSQFFDFYNKSNKFSLNTEQRKAIKSFLDNPVSIINGGPGTGKSTLIDAIVKSADELLGIKDYAILCPTGRAASRIRDMFSLNAKTFHSYLVINNEEAEYEISNAGIDADLLIIDEAVMAYAALFQYLLNKSKGVKRIVILGDVNQLPSIGIGNVFSDLIESNKIVTTTLVENNRVKGASIVELANKISNSSVEINDLVDTVDLKFISDIDNQNFYKMLTAEYYKGLPSDLQKSIEHIQVISPFYGKEKDRGINAINKHLQEINTSKSEIKSRFKLNDKTMFTKNDYEIELYNGDISYVIDIDNIGSSKKQVVKIKSKDREIEIKGESLKELTLAYATSVHKVQGGEYNKIIFVLDPSNWNTRNRISKETIYTAITRAKSELIIFADKNDFLNACSKKTEKRNTTLSKLIK
ncbi:exodeoxyribonuclease V alpha subunit [Spiroplasma sp. TIUS-1]|uniref:ATP-dependent DNA helicase n=1 Tax=Spiroplasma sp. TIUS-1 TaxID=216963 RepID=UPI00139854CD|nr:AAA family ATPase [Spiroplasma sp. TIUS-1]QHX35899.1 exodeoxyribonuclease V alpha subunit [Spiroplasma sp. TIUS-1]